MRPVIYATVLILAALLVPAVASAGANEGAALAGEAGVWTPAASCATLARDYCMQLTDVVITPPGPDNYVAAHVSREPVPLTLQGIDFGIEYTDAYGLPVWHTCGDLEVATDGWPASGTGIAEIWGQPRTGNLILVGWFRVTTYTGYGPMRFMLGAHPLLGNARAIDDLGNLDYLVNPAIVSHDGSSGTWNWCGGDPIPPLGAAPQTWGRIKAQYGR